MKRVLKAYKLSGKYDFIEDNERQTSWGGVGSLQLAKGEGEENFSTFIFYSGDQQKMLQVTLLQQLVKFE